mgnify:CR=1 FL=1
MKPLSTRLASRIAERQLMKSRSESRENYRRIRSALHLRLGQPSSLLVAAGVGAVIGVRFGRRNKVHVAPDRSAASAPLADLVSAILIRFGMQRLASAWVRLRNLDSATK